MNKTKKEIIFIIMILIMIGFGVVADIINKCQYSNEAKDISAIEDYVKDPKSIRIYGNILKLEFLETGDIIYSFDYDSKNGYGAYNGRSTAEIAVPKDKEPIFIDESSDYYFGIKDLVGRIDTEKGEMSELDGRIISAKLGFEYMK